MTMAVLYNPDPPYAAMVHGLISLGAKDRNLRSSTVTKSVKIQESTVQ